MNGDVRRRYIDLLKNALAFALWPEPPIPITTLGGRSKRVRRLLLSAVSKTLRRKGYDVYKVPRITSREKEEGLFWPGFADTMIGLNRLDSLQVCVETALDEGIAGDLIETGVWRGGACILMRGILAARGVTDRRVFVADSFEGLPKPDEERYPADKDDVHHTFGYLAVSKEEVEENFRKYDLLDDRVVFLKGWFKDTLPAAPIGALAVMRLDGDMYGSTMDALNALYPKLSPRGFCIIDDYALPGCRAAVDDYRARHGITVEMMKAGWSSVFWRK